MTRSAQPLPLGPAAGRAAFDRAEVLARVSGNVALLRELAGLFLEDSSKWMGQIREALRAGDAAGLRRAAHTLRGSVSSFGARPSEEAAGRLEELARDGDLPAAAEGFRVLEGALAGLRAELAELAQGRAPASRDLTPLPRRRPRIQEAAP
jgi:HPt (histidine-containing phosphotransfer) domain-containing protein